MFNCTPGLVISPLFWRVSTSGPLYCGYSQLFPSLPKCISGCLNSFHPTDAQLSNRNGKFVFSGMFHIMWADLGQIILLYPDIFLSKSDQLCINIIHKKVFNYIF